MVFKYLTLIIAALTFLVSAWNGCSPAKFSYTEQASKGGGLNFDSGDVDPDDFEVCRSPDPEFPNACLIFRDSFERDKIVEHKDFRWQTALMDNSNNKKNIDVAVESRSHLGHVIHGEKALLFRGRAGGSTHEVYVVSAPFDLSGYDIAYIQFKYVPISLEKDIKLSWNGNHVPEGVRIDVCNKSDYDCGLTGKNPHLRLRDPSNWVTFLPENPLSFGESLNRHRYNPSDWRTGKAVIDLKSLSRAGQFVFKISVALDEGYLRNDRNNMLEDGLIFDDIALIVVKE